MLRVTKKKASKLLAILLAVLMVVNIVPAGTILAVVKASDGFRVVKVGEEKVYLYGIDDVRKVELDEEAESYSLTYTGGDTETVDEANPEITIPETFEVYLDGKLQEPDSYSSDVQNKTNVLTIGEKWLKTNKNKWIAVCRDKNVEVPSEEPTGEDADLDFVGIEIAACSQTYDEGKEYPAIESIKENGVEILEDKNYIISYSTDGGNSWDEKIPMLTDAGEAGSLNVWVKVECDGYKAYVSKEPLTCSLKAKPLENVEVIPKKDLVYIGEPQQLIDSINVSYDRILYSTDGQNFTPAELSEIVGTDAGTYNLWIRVEKKNYISMDYPIQVTIGKAKIPESMVEVAAKEIVWNGSYIKYPIDSITFDWNGKCDLIGNPVTSEDFKITYYPKNKDEYSIGSRDPYKVKKSKTIGTYKARVQYLGDANYEDLIVTVVVTGEKLKLEIFFENEETVFTKNNEKLEAVSIYGEKNTFQHLIDIARLRAALELDETTTDEALLNQVTYAVNGNGSSTVPENPGMFKFSKAGDILVTAQRANQGDEDDYQTATKEYIMHVNYAESPGYILSKPVVTLDGRNWYKDGFNITAGAAGWHVNKIGNELGQPAANWTLSVAEEGATGQVTEYDNYKVAFRNSRDEITEYAPIKEKISVDKAAPEVTNFTFSRKNDSLPAKILNKLTFGLFFNEEIVVEVSGTDEGSGLDSFKLYKYDEKDLTGSGQLLEPEKVDEATGTSTFTLDIGFSGTVKAKAFDKVGNTSEEVLANTENSNIGDGNTSGYIMLETKGPDVSDIKDEPIGDVRKDSDNKIYSGDAKFTFTAQDADAGLSSVSVKINGEEYDGYPIYFKDRNRSLNTYTVDTVGKEPDDEGYYNVEVEVIDNAGNVTTKTTAIAKDPTSATITGFEFSLDKNIDVDGQEGFYDAVEVTDYGFYFKEPVTVTITAEDVKSSEDAKEFVSGVKSITYRTVDIDNGTFEKEVLVDSENKIQFTIDGDFKGQIYAYATDKIGNNPLTAQKLPDGYEFADLIDSEGFVHPNGSIVESEEMHQTTSSIDFTMPKAVGTQNDAYSYAYTGDAARDAEMDYEVSQQVPLYNADFTMGMNVTDTYSGIREMKWTLFEGETVVAKTITVDNDGVLGGDTEGWTSVKEDGSNLVTGISNAALSVSGNYNNMVMLVELTDRTGNRTYDYYAFGIDKTAPKIEVTYDNNSADAGANDGNVYFKADRTATVVISERNFNADKVVTVVTRDGQEITVGGNWVTTVGTGNGDDTTHKISIPYNTDGDYTYSVQYTDRATNPNTPVDYKNSVAPEKFTVDKTLPTISVSYNNNAARNGKYFKENRTATIVVTEHNFDVSRVRFTQTASLGGSAIGIPQAAWTHNGDVHTATIAYSTDGDYTFDVTMDDMAGNQSGEASYGSSVAGKDFTVDTKITKPVIKGIENGKAYKDAVIPEINFEDINFDTDEIKLTRTRKNEKDVDVTEEFIKYITKTATGISGVNDTFEDKQENDGIYTLSVKTTDKAGNEESETITFTVNRYGSVYVFSDYLMELIANGGAYVQDVKEDLIITEYNPDKLVEESLAIEITRDGKPVSDVKFNVSPVINDQVEVGESGWYQYEYTISQDNFKEDGVYKMAVSSKDATGNTPENTNYEELGILFRVDTTAPEITSIVGLEEEIINAQEVPVKYDVYDTIGLKSVSVYVDGELAGSAVTDFNGDLNNYEGDFKLQESNDKQNVRLVVEDLAGNVTDTDAKEFTCEYAFAKSVTVSTNLFVRWYANKALFWGSIGGTVIVLGGLFFLILFKKKKEEEEAAK